MKLIQRLLLIVLFIIPSVLHADPCALYEGNDRCAYDCFVAAEDMHVPPCSSSVKPAFSFSGFHPLPNVLFSTIVVSGIDRPPVMS